MNLFNINSKLEKIETRTLQKIVLVLTFCLIWSLVRERAYFISVDNAITATNQYHGGLSKIEQGWSGFNPFHYNTYWCVDHTLYYHSDEPNIKEYIYIGTVYIDLITGTVAGSSGSIGYAISK